MREAASAFLLACAIQPALAAESPSRTDGGPPAVEGVRVSPSGDHVLAVATEEGKRAVAVMAVAGGPLTVVLQTDVREQFLDECDWASDERIVCSVFFRKQQQRVPYSRRYRVRLVAVGRDGGERETLLNQRLRDPPARFGLRSPIPIFHDHVDAEHALVHRLPGDPQHVLLRAAREAEPYTSVYRVNVYDGTAQPVIEPEQGILFWHADRTGAVRLGTGWYELGPMPRLDALGVESEPNVGPTAVSIAKDRSASRIDVTRLAMPIGGRDSVGPRILGFNRDGSRVYYEAAVDGAERTSVWEASTADLAPRRQLVADPVRDVRANVIQGDSCGVVGFMHPLPGHPFTWLDEDIGADVAAAVRELRQEPVAVPSMSADCQRLVLATNDDSAGRRFHLLDRTDGKLRPLGTQHPGRTARGLERRRTTFTTRDGKPLPITVTRLPTADAELPVIVILDAELPPDSLERQDAWPGYFASRGYMVARPVVRGQRGYGWSNHLAGRRQHGVKLQEDAEDALGWLKEHGLSDARRACFLGRAAGGHLALAAALGKGASAAVRCVAAYAPKDIRRARRTPFGPFGHCLANPCDDWLRWAASDKDLERLDERRYGPQWVERPSAALMPTPSPVVGASHPGFPVLIWTDEGTVHGRESSDYHTDVAKLAVSDLLAPVGSDHEAAFLAAAEALFARQLKPALAAD